MDERRSVNTRYTLVDGQLQDQLFHFVYDHQKDQLLVEPTGRVLFIAQQENKLQAIDAIGMVIAPVSALKATLLGRAVSNEHGDTKETERRVDEWFNHLIQKAQDAHSQFFN